jgi:membrane protein implicated in regulation of membrane protease activity
MPTSVKRELIWLGIALLAGLLLFPLLVYATGMLTLGPYSRGGAGAFLADFLRSLGRLEWQALALAVAPPALILGWRAVRSRSGSTSRRAARGATERREPTL